MIQTKFSIIQMNTCTLKAVLSIEFIPLRVICSYILPLINLKPLVSILLKMAITLEFQIFNKSNRRGNWTWTNGVCPEPTPILTEKTRVDQGWDWGRPRQPKSGSRMRLLIPAPLIINFQKYPYIYITH